MGTLSATLLTLWFFYFPSLYSDFLVVFFLHAVLSLVVNLRWKSRAVSSINCLHLPFLTSIAFTEDRAFAFEDYTIVFASSSWGGASVVTLNV